MKSKKWFIFSVVAVLAVLAISVFLAYRRWIYTGDEEYLEKYLLKPHIPKEGESFNISVSAIYLNGTHVKGVEITFTDKETGKSETQITGGDGPHHFQVIVGHNYTITASFNNSIETITHKIGPKDMIVVIISEDNEVDSIYQTEYGII